MRDDASDTDHQVGVQHGAVHRHVHAPRRRAEIDESVRVEGLVVDDMDARHGLSAELGDDLRRGHRPVGPQRDNQGDGRICQTGAVQSIQQDGQDHVGGRGAGAVVGHQHEVAHIVHEIAQRWTADGLRKGSANLSSDVWHSGHRLRPETAQQIRAGHSERDVALPIGDRHPGYVRHLNTSTPLQTAPLYPVDSASPSRCGGRVWMGTNSAVSRAAIWSAL